MKTSPSRNPLLMTGEMRSLLRAQTALAVTAAGMVAQWAGIAARVAEGGAQRVSGFAEDHDPRFPDSYERLAAQLLADYTSGVRETAALPSTAALRFARELQKQRAKKR